MKSRISLFLNKLIDVPTTYPDNARRQKLLNILILSIFSLTALAVVLILTLQGFVDLMLEGNELYLASILMLGLLIIYFINRNKHLPGWLASFLFLIFLLIAFSFTDTPEQLAEGRSLFVFTIPIIMSSILLAPASSFLFAVLSTIELIVISDMSLIVPNGFAIGGFFLVALVSWLSSHNLEQALKELRVINVDLDHRVEDRTRAKTRPSSKALPTA
jgi:hypothetical protein